MSVGPFGQDIGNPLAGATTCPHCNGVADVSPHPRLNQVCNVCGAPRIKLAEGQKLSGKELPALKEARTGERKRLQWKAGGIFGGVTTGFIFAIWTLWALIFGAGAIWAVSGLALAAPFLALALGGLAKSKANGMAAQKALRQAWKSALRDILANHRAGLTADQLAEMVPLTPAAIEDLTTEMSVDNRVRSRVTEDGRLVYTSEAGPRIDTSAANAATVGSEEAIADPLERRFAELEQAQQEQDAEQQRTLEK